ncbi:MAG: patatin-like phospholipase family protein [Geminicoccaceae bacterium]
MPPQVMAFPDEDDARKGPEKGIALCLSGGGYRAMVFHLGALIRLNEAGLLAKLARVSSVSGGTITAAVLGLHWKDLVFDAGGVATNLGIVVDAVRAMADTSVDVGAVIGGILLPGTIADRVAAKYDSVLFRGATLQDLPDGEAGRGPRFVLNATNVQSAALWRFSRPYMGDYRVGMVLQPTLPLAQAVAASSAFPPVLSPMTLKLRQPVVPTKGADLSVPPYTSRAVLSDGGVYDNLGLETAFKRCTTLLVSDAGAKIKPEKDPADDWVRHSVRVLEVVDNQVRSLRTRGLIDAYKRGDRTGTYWAVRAQFADYELPDDPLGCAGRDSTYLAEIPTRLEEMPRKLQEQLVNWGYAICDTALRRWFAATAKAEYGVTIGQPKGFPYARGY